MSFKLASTAIAKTSRKTAIQVNTPWSITPQGKKFAFYSMGTVSVVAGVTAFAIQTLFAENYKDFYQLYSRGFAVQPSKLVKERFEKAIDLAQIGDPYKKNYKLFICSGFNTIGFGSFLSKFGSYIGVPFNFNAESVNEVDISNLQLGTSTIISELDASQRLLKSLVLSEKAQVYQMARQIHFHESFHSYISALFPSITIIWTFMMTESINQYFNLYTKPRFLRVGLYGVTLAFGIFTWMCLTDMTHRGFEMYIDAKIRKEPILRAGAIEYYRKCQQRNLAVRSLLGEEGKQMITKAGNEIHRYRCGPFLNSNRLEFYLMNVEDDPAVIVDDIDDENSM